MYFKQFPTIPYDSHGTGKFKDVKNLLRRVAIRSKVKTNTMVYDTYDVKNGETPESIAFKLYGDAELHWVIMLVNDITDRYHDWPMSEAQFLKFVNDKYDNVDAVHHYEIAQSSGPTASSGPEDYSYLVEVNSDESGATAVTNREYEQRIQDQKRQIRILDKRYLSQFIEEFEKLIQE